MEKKEYKCTAVTKQALSKAIIKLAKEKGYEKVTIREICKQAGISIGSFYHHYHSKEELAKEAYYRIDQLITEDFNEVSKQKPSKEILCSLLEIYIKYVTEDVGMVIKEYYKVMLEEKNISAFNSGQLYYQALKQTLINCAEEGVISEVENYIELTEYCIRFVRGLIFDWSVHDGEYDLLNQFHFDFERFMNGLAKG